MKVGRKRNPDRDRYAERYGLKGERQRRRLSLRMIEQLNACKNEAGRRLILGLSR